MKKLLKEHLNTVVTVITLLTIVFTYGVSSARAEMQLQDIEEQLELVHAQTLRNSIWNVYNNGNLDVVKTEVLFYGAEASQEYIGAGYNHSTKEKCELIYEELESR